MTLQHAVDTVHACCILHNYLINRGEVALFADEVPEIQVNDPARDEVLINNNNDITAKMLRAQLAASLWNLHHPRNQVTAQQVGTQ